MRLWLTSRQRTGARVPDSVVPTSTLLRRSLALRCHPDKATDPRSQAACAAVFKIAAEANAVLTDPGKRAAYDLLVTKQRLRAGIR